MLLPRLPCRYPPLPPRPPACRPVLQRTTPLCCSERHPSRDNPPRARKPPGVRAGAAGLLYAFSCHLALTYCRWSGRTVGTSTASVRVLWTVHPTETCCNLSVGVRSLRREQQGGLLRNTNTVAGVQLLRSPCSVTTPCVFNATADGIHTVDRHPPLLKIKRSPTPQRKCFYS